MTSDPSTDTLLTLYKSGAYLPFVIVAAYLGLKWGSARSTWLQVPGRAHWVAIIITALAALVPTAVNGTTPTLPMVLAAIGGAFALLLPGKPPATTDTGSANDVPPKPAQAGFAKFGLVMVLAMFGAIAACGWWSAEKRGVGGDAIDCLKAEQAKAITAFGPIVDQVLQLATGGDGKVDTDRLLDATKNLGVDVGGCVLADAVARALQPPAQGSNAPKSSPLVADPASLHAAFDTIRASRLQGKAFHTANGDL